MHQPSRQERRREELKRKKQARRQAARALRRRQAAEDLLPLPKASLENGKSAWKTIEEEKQARQETAEEQLRVYRAVLPRLLKRLAKIPDPRNPLLIRHKLAVLLLYEILMFVFQMASRREANREMSLPMFLQNLQLLFPELESLPHADTLNRLLARIDGKPIQEGLLGARLAFRCHDCPPTADRTLFVVWGTGERIRNWTYIADIVSGSLA
jgi:hypothetical protein